VSNQSDEETDKPLIADDRNYYKVEKWTNDGTKVDRMLLCPPLKTGRHVCVAHGFSCNAPYLTLGGLCFAYPTDTAQVRRSAPGNHRRSG
jgi:hypothetical protein